MKVEYAQGFFDKDYTEHFYTVTFEENCLISENFDQFLEFIKNIIKNNLLIKIRNLSVTTGFFESSVIHIKFETNTNEDQLKKLDQEQKNQEDSHKEYIRQESVRLGFIK